MTPDPTPDEAAAPCHVETFTDSSRAWGWQCFTCDRSEAGYPGLRMAETAGDRHRVDVATRNILAERDALRRDLAAAREDLEKATRLRLQLWDRLDKARAREAAARPVLDAARGYWRDGRTGPIVAAVVAYEAALAAARPVLDADRLARALHDADCGCGDYDEVEDPRYITAVRAALSAPVEAGDEPVPDPVCHCSRTPGPHPHSYPSRGMGDWCPLAPVEAGAGLSTPTDSKSSARRPHDAAATGLRPCKLRDSACTDPGCTVCFTDRRAGAASVDEAVLRVLVAQAPVEAGATAESVARQFARLLPADDVVIDVSPDGRRAHAHLRGEAGATEPAPDDDMDAYDAIEILRGRPDKASRTLAAAAQAVADWWNDPTYPYMRAEVEKAAPELAAAMWELLGGGPNSPALDARTFSAPDDETAHGYVVARMTDATAHHGDRVLTLWSDDVQRTLTGASDRHIEDVDDEHGGWEVYELRRVTIPLAEAGAPAEPTGDTERIRSPFTEDQQEGLYRWQNNPAVHPFTCPACGDPLIVDKHWRCADCDYTQYWAHAFMAAGGPSQPTEEPT